MGLQKGISAVIIGITNLLISLAGVIQFHRPDLLQTVSSQINEVSLNPPSDYFSGNSTASIYFMYHNNYCNSAKYSWSGRIDVSFVPHIFRL